MMWIVRVALRRPYTFICGALLVLIAGLVAIMTTPVDIFPAIPLPVATVIWQYQGMSPEEMEQRVVTIDRKSTRLNSSHLVISYAVFCLKKKKKNKTIILVTQEFIFRVYELTVMQHL